MLSIFVSLQNRLADLQDEQGATATEYALLITLIAFVLIAAVTAFGTFLGGRFDAVRF